MFARCRLQLLGDLRLTVAGKEFTAFRSKKVAEVLAYLALHGDRVSTREQVASILWPDEYDNATALNRLSNALSHIRSMVEPPSIAKGSVLDANRFSIRFRPEAVEVDVFEFKAAIRSSAADADLQSKIDLGTNALWLYKGDFAPILDSEWAFAERIRLQDSYALLLAKLCDYWEQAGELATAMDYGSRLLALDEYSESSHARMIRLYLSAGRESAARDQLAALREVLEEMDAKPSGDTLALFEAVSTRGPVGRSVHVHEMAITEPQREEKPGASETAKPSLPSQITRFFGREPEIHQVADLLLMPDVRLVTLIGTGGSGKTRLATEIARRVSENLKAMSTLRA